MTLSIKVTEHGFVDHRERHTDFVRATVARKYGCRWNTPSMHREMNDRDDKAKDFNEPQHSTSMNIQSELSIFRIAHFDRAPESLSHGRRSWPQARQSIRSIDEFRPECRFTANQSFARLRISLDASSVQCLRQQTIDAHL